MKYALIALSLFLSCITLSHAQLGGTPIAPPVADANKLNKKPEIRFVLRNQEGALENDAFMLVEDMKTVPVDLRLGLPGRRVAIPKFNHIRVYAKEPTPQEIKKGTAKPIFNAPIPAGLGPKIIGLIGYSSKGYDIQFIDESELKPGLVHFVNLTSKNYLVDVPKAPGSEPKRFDLKPGAQYTFGKTLMGDLPDSIPFRIYHQVQVKGKMQWIVDRRTLMSIGKTRSSILVLMPDPAGTSMIMHELIVYK